MISRSKLIYMLISYWLVHPLGALLRTLETMPHFTALLLSILVVPII